jgi:hypothetical protein
METEMETEMEAEMVRDIEGQHRQHGQQGGGARRAFRGRQTGGQRRGAETMGRDGERIE